MCFVRQIYQRNKNVGYCCCCQSQLFPLTRKKVPVATPISPRARPTPQNTAGPTLGTETSTSTDNTEENQSLYHSPLLIKFKLK